MTKFLKQNRILILILLLGIFFRVYKPLEMFMYSHDQDLAAWIVSDVLQNHHIRLIGQETSSPGVFIGMGYYYLLIPFYLLFKMSPVGGIALSTLVSAFTIFSYYYVFKEIFDRKTGLVASFIYALSNYAILTDREVVPTITVMAWAVWFLWAQHKLIKNKQRAGFTVSAILLGLVWHINLGLLVLAPLPILSLLFSKQKPQIKPIIFAAMVFVFFSLPLFVFEVRHNFSQTRAILGSLSAEEEVSVSRLAKFDRVMQLNVKNTSRLIGTHDFNFKKAYSFYGLLLIFALLIIKKKLDYKLAVICVYWLFIYTLFFTFNSINTSEYYLNGMIVIWIMIIAVGLSQLLKIKKYSKYGFVLLAAYAALNIYNFLSINPNKSGYLYRSAIIAEIKADAAVHSYPCISISYITKPGYELGYRYLFKLQNMHVNAPKGGSPVYTIVYPLHLVNGEVDKTFGVLGLIYPEYDNYPASKVAESCRGENSNLTDPLFGFTR